MLLIYVASAYTRGNKDYNVQRQIEAAHTLMDYGYATIWPLSSHYLELFRSRPYDEWLELDFALLSRCDALLRLEGDSTGADLEVKEATRLGIPVFYNVESLRALEGR